MAQAQTLSRNQQIVLDIIEKAKGPLKAYSILFNVQKKRNKCTSTDLSSFRQVNWDGKNS